MPSPERPTASAVHLDFDEMEEDLEPISWKTWLNWFDGNGLALLKSGDSRFNEMIGRNR